MTRSVQIVRVQEGQTLQRRSDDVAVEEPLEIRVEGIPIAVTMRTPGQDRELAAGWLLSEGVVRTAAEIAEVVSRPGDESQPGAMVDIMLRDPKAFDHARHQRNVLTNASCGLCGAASIERILRDFPPVRSNLQLDISLLHRLPERLRQHQPAFDRTGGVHACALFDREGNLLAVREDVGRHNALDKLLGWALWENRLPLSEAVLLLSGRVSLEMTQKAVAAGIPVLAAIGAPTSLAVELAEKSGLSLAAFLRSTSMNLYGGSLERLRGAGGL